MNEEQRFEENKRRAMGRMAKSILRTLEIAKDNIEKLQRMADLEYTPTSNRFHA